MQCRWLSAMGLNCKWCQQYISQPCLLFFICALKTKPHEEIINYFVAMFKPFWLLVKKIYDRFSANFGFLIFIFKTRIPLFETKHVLIETLIFKELFLKHSYMFVCVCEQKLSLTHWSHGAHLGLGPTVGPSKWTNTVAPQIIPDSWGVCTHPNGLGPQTGCTFYLL